MRWRYVALALIVAAAKAQEPDRPAWFDDKARFCTELAQRANGESSPKLLDPRSIKFSQYPVKPIAVPRKEEAAISKEDAYDDQSLRRAVKLESTKGPDFAGRYFVVMWSCGSWCGNALIADIRNGRTYSPQFAGVVGCQRVTGNRPTIEHKADSRLLIVRGSLELEISNSHYVDEGPCGTFYYLWQQTRLQLIGCELSDELP